MSELLKRLVNLSPEKRELVLKKLEQQKGISTKDKDRWNFPITSVPRDQNIPLSFAQQQLWFLDQLNPGLTAYNLPFDLYLIGTLNESALEQSIHEIVQRHEVLRTTFKTVDGQPVQVIAPILTIPLSKIDLRHFPKNERESEVQRLALEEVKRPFDLKEGPLFRTTLLQLDKDEHAFLITMHHIVYDGVSIEVFIQELAVLYEAFSTGRPSPLSKLSVQYADFAHWQREWLQGEKLEQLLSYWKHQLSGNLPILDLPVDHPRPANQTFQGDSLFFVFSQPLSEAIKTLSRQEKVTVFVTLLAAFKTLLYRYTGQQDIIVGSDISNRNQPELENMIGFFVNTVVLRTNLSGDPTFRELLRRIRKVSLEAQEHRDMPFDLLVSELQPNRELSRQSLFQVMFDLQSLSLQLPELSGVILKPMFVPNGGAKFDINIEMIDTVQGLRGAWEYNTDLFETATIQRMIEYFRSLLEAVVTNPDQRISEISLLSDAEQHQLLVEWNATHTEFPRDKCFHQLFECQAEDTPDTVAVICGDQKLTYHELNVRANHLARILREHGAGPDIVVALLAERGIEFLITILAIFKAGSAYLPLDPHHPKNRIIQVLGQSESPLVLAGAKFKPLLLEAVEELPSEKRPQVLFLKELLEQDRSEENLPINCSPENLAYVIYTSGSTGVPKGAMLEHRGMLNHLYAKILDLKLTGNDIIAQTASQCFDISVWQFLAALLVGGQVHIFDDEIVYNPSLLLEQIDRHNITIFETVPSLLRMILEGIALNGSLRYKLSQLRWLVPTGEALPPELSRQWLRYYPNIPLLNAYGPTECSDDVTHYPIYQPPSDEVFNMPIGRPIANMQMYILDSRLQPVPRGVIGELYVGGIGVGRGYLNDPERTAETFIPDPFSQKPNSRFYKTGDIARYLPHGNIEFLGRVDHQVKIRGFRIELGEITTVLNQHPSVHEAVVIAREDYPGDKRLVAYLVPNPESSVILDELRQYLKEKLPEYMMPSAFVLLNALPLTPNGKIDRRALPAPEAVMSQQDEEQSVIGPRNPVERIVLEIWLDLLKRESISIHDNFFDLGGHSLLVVQTAYRIREIFQIEFPVQRFFESPTIAELAQIIQTIRKGEPVAEQPGSPVIDFAAEATLDSSICSEIKTARLTHEPASIFLTGATGFLGAFLLHELLQQTQADVYCLVRSANVEEGRKRIQNTLESYTLWNEGLAPRIVPIPGDLSQPLLGLSGEQFEMLAGRIESIYHCGASVNFIYPYTALKVPNVLGTQEIIKLACHITIKPLHYISTNDAVGNAEGPLVRECELSNPNEALDDGYSKSKWVAEKLVTIARHRGLPVCIYRPGTITGHSQTGICNRGDFVSRVIKGCIQMRSIPAQTIIEDMTPVDYVSRAIVYLSKQPESLKQIFHLVNPQPLSWHTLAQGIRSYGYPIKEISYKQWQEQLIQLVKNQSENALHTLLPLFLEPEENAQESEDQEAEPRWFDCQNALAGLAGTSIICPPVDENLLQTYFSYFIRSGFLDPPQVETKMQ